jgi:uncharacterized protein YkwD
MKASARYLLSALLAGVSLACDVITPVTPDAVGRSSGSRDQENVISSPGTSDFAAELALCVDETNRYRSSVGRPALTRSAALEAFAAEAARQDTLVRQAHYYFKSTNGNNIARAENEILWWRGFTIEEVIRQGLAQMWRSGPSGEHYDIIVGPYTHVGCGIYVGGNGREVTVAQDFH